MASGFGLQASRFSFRRPQSKGPGPKLPGRWIMARRVKIVVLFLCGALSALAAQVTTVRGRVEVEGAAKGARGAVPATVVWLTPVPGTINGPIPEMPSPPAGIKLLQKN